MKKELNKCVNIVPLKHILPYKIKPILFNINVEYNTYPIVILKDDFKFLSFEIKRDVYVNVLRRTN